MTWPPTAAQVAAFGGIDRVSENTALEVATAGAVAFVERVRADLFNTDDPPVFVPTPDVVVGTKMLAVNDYERRGAASGKGEVDRFDRDRIDELLQIGRHQPFGFGSKDDTPVEEVVA